MTRGSTDTKNGVYSPLLKCARAVGDEVVQVGDAVNTRSMVSHLHDGPILSKLPLFYLFARTSIASSVAIALTHMG